MRTGCPSILTIGETVGVRQRSGQPGDRGRGRKSGKVGFAAEVVHTEVGGYGSTILVVASAVHSKDNIFNYTQAAEVEPDRIVEIDQKGSQIFGEL